MERILRKAQMLRRFNDAEHKPQQVAGREVVIPAPDGGMRALWYVAARRQAPLFVDLHGGAYFCGSPEEDDAFCAALCRALDVNVVSLDYPLAPEARYPEALGRIYATIVCLRGDAAQWGVDPQRVSIGGHSVGGGIAAAICMLAKARGDLPLRCQVLDHPALDMGGTIPLERKHADALALSQAFVDFGASCYAEPEQYLSDALCTPCIAHAAQLEGLPPAIVLTCERDSLRTEGEMYADMLRSAGVEVCQRRFPGAQHGFTVFPGPLREAGQRFLFDCMRNYIL